MPEYSLLYQQCFPPQLCPPNKAPKTASKEDDSRALVKGEEWKGGRQTFVKGQTDLCEGQTDLSEGWQTDLCEGRRVKGWQTDYGGCLILRTATHLWLVPKNMELHKLPPFWHMAGSWALHEWMGAGPHFLQHNPCSVPAHDAANSTASNIRLTRGIQERASPHFWALTVGTELCSHCRHWVELSLSALSCATLTVGTVGTYCRCHTHCRHWVVPHLPAAAHPPQTVPRAPSSTMQPRCTRWAAGSDTTSHAAAPACLQCRRRGWGRPPGWRHGMSTTSGQGARPVHRAGACKSHAHQCQMARPRASMPTRRAIRARPGSAGVQRCAAAPACQMRGVLAHELGHAHWLAHAGPLRAWPWKALTCGGPCGLGQLSQPIRFYWSRVALSFPALRDCKTFYAPHVSWAPRRLQQPHVQQPCWELAQERQSAHPDQGSGLLLNWCKCACTWAVDTGVWARRVTAALCPTKQPMGSFIAWVHHATQHNTTQHNTTQHTLSLYKFTMQHAALSLYEFTMQHAAPWASALLIYPYVHDQFVKNFKVYFSVISFLFVWDSGNSLSFIEGLF